MDTSTFKASECRADLETRLAYLDRQEALTQQVAPTDSGVVRRQYLAEARQIRQQLGGQ